MFILSYASTGRIQRVLMLPQSCCCFVDFIRSQDAAEAIHQLQNKAINGSFIKLGYGKVTTVSTYLFESSQTQSFHKPGDRDDKSWDKNAQVYLFFIISLLFKVRTC